MSPIVYRITALLAQVLKNVPVGTNLGLFPLLFALLSGRFLNARGAVFPALADLGLSPQALRRAQAALCYARFSTKRLFAAWRALVLEEGHFRSHVYEGVRPVACDVTAFFRPHLQGCANKHYTSGADKALPAVPLGLVGEVGAMGKTRLALPRLVLRAEPAETDAALQKRLVAEAAKTLGARPSPPCGCRLLPRRPLGGIGAVLCAARPKELHRPTQLFARLLRKGTAPQ